MPDTSKMIVYQVTNTINGKKYIGQTSRSPKERWGEHQHPYKNLSTFPLSSAIRKYGIENFIFKILASFQKKQDMDAFEIFLIDVHDTTNPEKGYNLARGGGGPLGYRHTAKAREKIRVASIGRKNNLGKKHSVETRTKMSLAHRNLSSETRVKLSIAGIGNKNGLGYKHTQEEIEKIRTATIKRNRLNDLCSKGSHTRWHINRGFVDINCKFCILTQRKEH